MTEETGNLIFASDGQRFRMMTASDRFDWERYIRFGIFRTEVFEGQEFEEMDDEEVLQARRILLLEEIERQKLVAHSRTARHPEMIMAYEKEQFAKRFIRELGNKQRDNTDFDIRDPLRCIVPADSWWEKEEIVLRFYNPDANPSKFAILTADEQERERRLALPSSDEDDIMIVDEVNLGEMEVMDSEDERSHSQGNHTFDDEPDLYRSEDDFQPVAGPSGSQNRGGEEQIPELVISDSDSNNDEVEGRDRMDIEQKGPVETGSTSGSVSRDPREFADDSEIDSGEEGDDDDQARPDTPPMSDVRRGKQRARSMSRPEAQLPTPRLTTSRSASLKKPSPPRPSHDAMSGPAEIETATEEERDLRGKVVMRTTRGKKKEAAKRTIRVNRVRTEFNPRKTRPQLPNPWSELLLRDFFYPDLKSTRKAVFYLSDFEVTSAPNMFIDLTSLFDMKSGFEIAGHALPVPNGGLQSDHSDHYPEDRNQAIDDSDQSIDEHEASTYDETPGVKRVTLYGQDAPKLTLTLHGYIINTKYCRFILQHPTQNYKNHTLDAAMLLNVWAFARSKRIRGAFSTEEEDQEVENVARDVRRQLATMKEERPTLPAWQKSLPADWRSPVSQLKLEDKLARLLFHSLPNIPWMSPKIYASIEDHFLPFSSRTHDPSGNLAEKAASERQRGLKLLDSLATEVRAWKSAPVTKSVVLGDSLNLLHHPDPAERSEPVRLFQKMVVRDDPTDKRKGTLYRIGDVVLVSPPLEQGFRLHKSHPPEKTRLQTQATDDEWETSEAETEVTSDEDDDNEVSSKEKQNSTRLLWFARIESIFQPATRVKEEDEEEDEEEDAKEVRLHLTYYTLGDVIPSIRTYFSPRQLFLLDSCTSIAASTIVRKVEYTEVRPGEAMPEEGFYSRSIYNEEDGSIQDIDTSLSFVHCDRAEIPHCDSCENNLAYAVASEIKQDQIAGKEQEEKKEKNWTPIRLDGDNENSFRYANRQYHKHDFILLSPQEVTLPNAPPSDPRRWPFRLAQLVSISPESSPQPSQSPEVTNLGRLSKLKVRWVIRRSETGKVASFQSERELLITDIVDEGIDVNRLEGHFNLHHISQVRTITENQNDHEALALYQRDNLNFFFDSKIERKDGAPLQVHGEHEVLSARASQLQEVTVEAGAIEHCDVCRKEEEDIRGRDRRIGEALRSKRGDRLAMKSLSLYSGGGGLDIGLGLGCKALKTAQAVEIDRAAVSVFIANHDTTDVARMASSDYIEEIFYDRRDRPFFASITGGAPCQGFSSANLYKKADDLRCLEPFVFLTALDVLRPLHATFENVKGYLDHALPASGSLRGSFFELFIATALKIGYQVRWNLSNAAGFGSPQDRRRLIVQFALPGVPLPKTPRPTHAYKDSLYAFDHRLREENWKKIKMNRESSGYGAHHAVTVKDAIGDLPSFSVKDLYDKKTKTWEHRPFGYSWSDNPAIKTPYPQSLPFTSYQLRSRTAPNLASLNKVTFSRSVTHHICGTPSLAVLERLRNLGIRGVAGKEGNYEDLRGLSCEPNLPPWLERASKSRRKQFWGRLLADSIVATLRTTLNIDGASHGARIHYDQARWLSLRELMRIQGLPDSFEMVINHAAADTAIADMIRIIGNGVPVPLAEAFGRAQAEVADPLIDEYLSSSSTPLRPREDLFERIWRERCGGDELIVDVNRPMAPIASSPEDIIDEYDSDCIIID